MPFTDQHITGKPALGKTTIQRHVTLCDITSEIERRAAPAHIPAVDKLLKMFELKRTLWGSERRERRGSKDRLLVQSKPDCPQNDNQKKNN